MLDGDSDNDDDGNVIMIIMITYILSCLEVAHSAYKKSVQNNNISHIEDTFYAFVYVYEDVHMTVSKCMCTIYIYINAYATKIWTN